LIAVTANSAELTITQFNSQYSPLITTQIMSVKRNITSFMLHYYSDRRQRRVPPKGFDGVGDEDRPEQTFLLGYCQA
jgi:hypothetical protein